MQARKSALQSLGEGNEPVLSSMKQENKHKKHKFGGMEALESLHKLTNLGSLLSIYTVGVGRLIFFC